MGTQLTCLFRIMVHITSRDMLCSEDDVDFDPGIIDERLKDTKQYVMSPCYGRGLRLEDMTIPAIPPRLSQPSHSAKKLSEAESLPCKTPMPGRGRGRGKRRSKNSSPNSEVSASSGNKSDQCVPDEVHHVPTNEAPDCFADAREEVGWSLLPPTVCQINGLPQDFDTDILRDLIGFYGAILDTEEIRKNGRYSVRFKMDSPDTCDHIVDNLNDTDFMGTGSPIQCIHLKL